MMEVPSGQTIRCQSENQQDRCNLQGGILVPDTRNSRNCLISETIPIMPDALSNQLRGMTLDLFRKAPHATVDKLMEFSTSGGWPIRSAAGIPATFAEYAKSGAPVFWCVGR